MAKGEQKTIKIENIKRDPYLQMRAEGTNPGHVEDLREVIRSGEADALPRVPVYVVNGEYLNVDANHTLDAYTAEGKKMVPAVIYEGSYEDAVLAAAKANNSVYHKALKLTRADKRLKVERMLEKFPNWTPGKIADHVGVSAQMVRDYLEEHPNLLASQATQIDGAAPVEANGHAKEAPRRVGRGGKTFKQKAAKSKEQEEADKLAYEEWRAKPVRDFLQVEEHVLRHLRLAKVENAGDLYDRLQMGGKFPMLTSKEVGELFRQVTAIRPKVGTPAKQQRGGVVGYDWNRWETQFGVIARAADDIVAMYPEEKGSEEAKQYREAAKVLAKVQAGWKKRLTKHL